MTIYLLVNPHAGSKKADIIIQKIQEEFADVRIFKTRWKNDESEQIKTILQTFSISNDQLAIIGGDGTLSKVLAQLPSEIPFAYFPAGSGNDFAHSLGLTFESSLKALQELKMTSMTILTYEEGIIVNSLDTGFAAQVIAYSEDSTLKKYLNQLHIGKLTYLVMAIRTLFKRDRMKIDLVLDGEPIQLTDLFFFSIANATYFGGGIMIWPDATVDKSMFDVVYIKDLGFFRNLFSLLDLVLKRHKISPTIQHLSGKKAHLSFPTEQMIQVDGEVSSIQQVTIRNQLRKIYQ